MDQRPDFHGEDYAKGTKKIEMQHQKYVSALIVAFATGCNATGFWQKSNLHFVYPAGYQMNAPRAERNLSSCTP